MRLRIEVLICIDPRGRRLLEAASERLGLSARAYTRILRVARTIADLAGEEEITTSHLGGGDPVPKPRPAYGVNRPGILLTNG